MSDIQYVVASRGRAEIRAAAALVRKLSMERLGPLGPRFPIIEVIERVLPQLDPEFHFEVWDSDEMGEDHGLTIPGHRMIVLRSDVYDGACDGKGRDRLTAAHELGHYLLHHDAGLHRRMSGTKLAAYRDPEWQAKCFSGELLVDPGEVRVAMTVSDVAAHFGVSEEAAQYQVTKYREAGLIKG